MGDRKNAPTSTSAGVLRPEALAQHVGLNRDPVPEVIAPWAENFWSLRWDLPARTRYVSSTLPHPACNLSVEGGNRREGLGKERAVVTGVVSRRFDVTLQGSGWVYAAKFRPGGLTALCGVPARQLRDKTLPAADVLSSAAVAPLRALDGEPTASECQAAFVETIAGLDRSPNSDYDRLLDIVSTMLEERSLIRVVDVERRCDLSARRLQRLFSHYLGVGPKWVLARYRIHDVVSELDRGYPGSLADLAAEYGWFDQAHFTREFTDLVGVTPGRYQDRCGAPSEATA